MADEIRQIWDALEHRQTEPELPRRQNNPWLPEYQRAPRANAHRDPVGNRAAGNVDRERKSR
ncbi:hypothetical protein [Brachybacterium subflavum]|uniref:hypothetical protein n=1 Tax=Brachybacterium subflavum TaxID=2585206 RepID=UPI0012665616|nr:hypothetical protein [Brachybacterium subflavum]